MENDSAIPTYIVAFGAAAAGALVGSVSAYLLGRRQQKQDEDNRQFGALIKTQFILFSQWKVVDGLRINHLEPLKNDKDRFAKLRATYFIKAPSVPLTEITFIANSKTPNLLQEIYDVEESYLHTMIALDLFNQFHAQFEKKYPPIPGTLNKEKTSGFVAPDEFDVLMGNYYVNELYKQVDLASPILFQAIEKIADYVRQNFKDKKPIKIEDKTTKKEQAL